MKQKKEEESLGPGAWSVLLLGVGSAVGLIILIGYAIDAYTTEKDLAATAPMQPPTKKDASVVAQEKVTIHVEITTCIPPQTREHNITLPRNSIMVENVNLNENAIFLEKNADLEFIGEKLDHPIICQTKTLTPKNHDWYGYERRIRNLGKCEEKKRNNLPHTLEEIKTITCCVDNYCYQKNHLANTRTTTCTTTCIERTEELTSEEIAELKGSTSVLIPLDPDSRTQEEPDEGCDQNYPVASKINLVKGKKTCCKEDLSECATLI